MELCFEAAEPVRTKVVMVRRSCAVVDSSETSKRVNGWEPWGVMGVLMGISWNFLGVDRDLVV